MPLLIGYDPAGLDSKVRRVLDDITAAVQVWAGRVDGINAEERLNQLGLATVKPGVIEMYGGSSAPSGYLLCDGSAVSRATYAGLFAVLGTTYGAGNGSTTFNVPNLRQRFPLGKAASGTGATLGSTGGTIDHTHTGPSHTHGAGSYATPTHNHGGETGTDDDNENVQNGAGVNVILPVHPHSHGITTEAAMSITGTSGSGGTGNTGSANPPFCVVNFIVKT